MALSDRARTLGISIAFHVGIVAALFTLARSDIFVSELAPVIEFEMFVEPVPIEAPVPPEPAPIPTEKRPELVPEETVVQVKPRARAFRHKAKTTGHIDAPEDAEGVAAPTTPLVFSMTETVGGGSGVEYESTTSGTMALPPSGPSGGAPGEEFTPGAAHVKVAPDWQVTTQASPLNDRSFEPRYPSLAKRQGREAVIVVSLDIDTNGVVVGAKAISGPVEFGFQSAALAYARKLKFKPAMAGNNPVASRTEWTVHFYVRN